MKIFILIIITLIFTIINCSTNKYITHTKLESKFEGTWQINNQQDTKLVIHKVEENVYNIKFTSELYSWEGIGYQIGNELLAIFNYFYIGQKGYVTFRFIGEDKVSFKSINTDGTPRSEGVYLRINSL